MYVNTEAMVSMTEANQNFSRVARLVDEKGSVIILKNNSPRYLVIDFSKANETVTASDEDVLAVSSEIFQANREAYAMLEEYDFSKAEKNPYARKLKKQITINIDIETVDYFKAMSQEDGIPYQTLINMYLADCAENKRKLQLSWS